MKKALPLLFVSLLVCISRCTWSQSLPSDVNSQQTGCSEDASDPDQACGQALDNNQEMSSPYTQGMNQNGNQESNQDNAREQGNPSGASEPVQRSSAAEYAPLLNRQQNNLPRATPRPTPLPSDEPTEFQNFVAEETGKKIPIYGVSLFRRVPSTFSPSNLTPVSANYVIGPDDELRVRIWGATTYSGNLRVDRSGSIFIPQVGSVQVAGLKFSQLDQHLRSAVAKEYSNFDLSVELGRIRSIQIYVTGQARRPGVYTVSSMSSLVDALFASGGPSPQGSMRQVELKREGKVVASFDLYDLLLRGDKSADAQLQAEDVLYIPPAGGQVAILGSVRSPAIYELRGHETLGEMLNSAGGTSALSSHAKISVDRVNPEGHREAVEFEFDPKGLMAVLLDGDIIRIEPTIPAYRNTVTLRGNVANPGHFSWKPGMHLSDIIPDRDSLLSRDYWWQRAHLGLPTPEFESEVVPQQLLAQKLKQSIESPLERATSQGQTDRAQRLGMAGLDAQHSASHASLAADNSSELTEEGNAQPKLEVRLLGHEIDWNYAVIERTDPATLKTSLIPFDLGKLIVSHDESQNVPLQPGDTITIFSQNDIRIPIDEETKYVTIEGEVGHSGTYSVKPGETLRDLIVTAGGFTPKAYLYGSEFTRESARKFQQRRIDEYVQQVDLEVRRGSLAVANASLPTAVGALNTSAQDRFLEELRLVRASGRIVLQLHPDQSSLDSIPRIELENGDHFTIPSIPATINVVGAVYNENVFLYQRADQAKDYLNLAGGPNRNADTHKMFIIRANGSVESRDAAKGIFGDAFLRAQLHPGDTLVVPDKNLKPNTSLKTFLDYSQAFSQVALGAAAISVLK